MHNKTNALVQAHLQHILSNLGQFEVVAPEVDALLDWLSTQSIGQLISLQQLQQVAQVQALDLPLTAQLKDEIVAIIQAALDHPINQSTPIGSLLPAPTMPLLAAFIGSQKQTRELIVHEVFSNPIFAQTLSQTISHAIHDYMENNILAKKMPAMGGLMKMGKSLVERATDSNLDDALNQYLNKNISNLIAVSERMTNKHLTDQQVQTIVLQTWQKIEKQPVSQARRFAPAATVEQVASLVPHVWDHLRQTQFMQTQVHSGLATWYERNQKRSLVDILADVNVSKASIAQELERNIMPIIACAIDSGYAAKRIEPLLVAFYHSAETQAILAD